MKIFTKASDTETILRNFVFRRMRKDLFEELLFNKGVHEIFLDIHEEISQIFQ